jgi:hypothetical protein
MAKERTVHTSLRLSQECYRNVLLYCEKHIITNISDGVRRLIHEGLGLQPQELIVCKGVANQEQFESMLGRLTDWVNVLRDVKNSLRKTLPPAGDPELYEQVKKWRAASDTLLSQGEALRTQVAAMAFIMGGIQPAKLNKLRAHRQELVTEFKALKARAGDDPEAKKQMKIWLAVIEWLSAFGA